MKLLMWIFCLIIFVSHGEGEETRQIGVRFVLDNMYQELFLKYHRNQSAYLDVYLQAFLNSVSLFFRDIKNPSLKFVLVGTYNMTVNDTFLASKNNGSNEELLYLLQDLGIRQNFPSDDLVFFLHPFPWPAPYEFNTSFFDGFCNARGYGFVHDNAKTFSGVTMAARQFARLLGANADSISGCPRSTYLMANNISSSDMHTLSNCSKRAIEYKLQTIKNCSCLRTDSSLTVNSTYLPSDFLNGTDICTLQNENYTFCDKPGTQHTQAFVLYCNVFCCEKGTNSPYLIIAPDGTKSKGCQLCLAGKCTNETTTSSGSTPEKALWNVSPIKKKEASF
uniref:Putative metalloprotease n=1 Tax=Ixodes ricinus TaxID=34613 RepID=A0A0K8RLY1_IXORI